jgi:hypothetical protein
VGHSDGWGDRRKALIVVGGVSVVGVALWVYVVMRGDPVRKTALPEADDDASVEPGYALAPAAASTANDGSAAATPVLDKQKRDAMREAIYRAWGMAPPDEHTNPATWPTRPGATSSEGFGDKDYIQHRIREDYFPLAKDCYERGLKKDPKLGGKIVASFRIVGSKGTGGLIDWVELDEETTLADADVRECLKQSLYSVTFEPPPHDGVVTVTYPINFAPDEPDE